MIVPFGHLPAVEACQLDAAKQRRAAQDPPVLSGGVDRAHGERGLARAGLSDDPEAFLLLDAERCSPYRAKEACFGFVAHGKIQGFEDDRARRHG